MGLSSYRDVWTTHGVPSLLVATLLARLPTVATSIPLAFLAKDAAGTFEWAGVVVGGYAVGLAVGAPLWSRRADRLGPRRVLMVTGVVWAVALTALAALPDGAFRALPVMAALAGLALPPVSSTTRAAWPRFFSGTRLNTAYTLDATATEVLFAVGPMLGAVLVTVASPRAGLFAAAGWAVAATWWFVRQLPEVGPRDHDVPPMSVRAIVWHRHRLALIVAFALAATSFSATSLGIAAFADEHGNRMIAGWLETVWAFGSLTGGLVAGALPGRHPSHAWRRTALIGVGMAACAFATASPWTLGVAMFGCGLMLAPTVAVMYERIGALTPAGARTEAFGWMNGAAMLSSAAGAAVAGSVVEALGVPYVFGLSALIVLVAGATLVRIPPRRAAITTSPGDVPLREG